MIFSEYTICIFVAFFRITASAGIPDEVPKSSEASDISSNTSSSLGIDLQPIDDENLGVGRVNLDLDPNIGIENETSDCKHQCVWYYQCSNGSINTNGAGIINIREKDLPCGDIFHVCCKLEDVSTSPITPAPPPVSRPKGCGYRRSNGIGIRITGDEAGESQFGEFPWMVAIFKNVGPNDVTPFPKCGGALIHPQAVITAAHCVTNKAHQFSVRAGEWNLNVASEPFLHQDVPVRSVKIHHEFYSGALFNDIAFLYLDKPVELAANVEVICLPPQNFSHRAASGRCFSTGWGKNREGRDGQYQSIMKKIDLPFVPRDTCQAQLRKTRLGNFFNLHRSFMCAGGEKDKDACTGDGGSPLVCPLEGPVERYYQAGIVAWGIGCGDADVPGVYVDVGQFREWIDEQMRFNGLETGGYVTD